MKTILTTLLALMFAGVAYATPPAYHRDIPANLASEAKISEEAALSTALHAVPNGKVRSVELERENGQLLYSIDIKVAGKKGIEEIHVNALDGRMLSRQHESAQTERKEAAAEKNEASQQSHK